MALSKAATITVSLILVVGVVVGVVVFGEKYEGHSSGGGEKSLSTNMKAVQAICETTTYKDKCVSTIAPVVAANSSAGLKDYLRAVVVATMEEVKLGIEKPGAMNNDRVSRIDKMSLEDCEGYLKFAVKDLQEALALLDVNEVNGINDEVNEFRNWFTAAYGFQVTCMDLIEDPHLKAGLQMGLQNGTLLATNGVDIFAKLSTIFVALNIPLNVNPVPNQHRKLFDVGHVDEHGYPHWISEGDRRLLLQGMPIPNVIVAQDGSGHFKTIKAAVASYPKGKIDRKSRYIIYVKAGIYNEGRPVVSMEEVNVFMYGDGPDKTIITGDKSKKINGLNVDSSASFSVFGNGFVAMSMGFHNTAKLEGEQAVALQACADRVALFDCHIVGNQDTLYAQQHRQFYRDCVIFGTIDFVFGRSATVIQNSIIRVRKPLDGQQTIVAADGSTKANLLSGLVFQNCTITPEKELLAVKFRIPSYLARPWQPYSTAIFMESSIDDFIDPKGFSDFHGENIQNCFFAEYGNRGPGARTDRRVNWPGCRKVFTDQNQAFGFTLAPFIRGNKWLRHTRIPFTVGLTNAS